jgi:hypothetical protein
MRNELMLTFSLLSAIPLLPSTINVRTANIIMSSIPGVRAACNGVVDTGCSRFDGTLFYCECGLQNDRWTPHVRIEAQPRIYISSHAYLLHEFGHVFDFQYAMRLHAADIESHTFATRRECDTFSEETHNGFDNVLLDFRRTSMLRRDHQPGEPPHKSGAPRAGLRGSLPNGK